MTFKLIQGNSSEVLKQYQDNYFDSIVTDPPYGIEFLGKDWDKNTGAVEVWQECLRVLKPGGHILAFSAARTYHRLATNLEDVGFEIRDQIMWIYSSGFPKGQDMGKLIEKREGKRKNAGSNKLHIQVDPSETGNTCKTCGKRNTPLNIVAQCQIESCNMKERIKPADNEWSGWKTALKPSHEPIVMARKPFKGSTIDNVIKYGTGALNIDDTRIIPDSDDSYNQIIPGIVEGKKHGIFNEKGKEDLYANRVLVKNDIGRFPSNIIGEIDEKYQKYFYCPKVSRKERHIGLESPKALFGQTKQAMFVDGKRTSVILDGENTIGNNHPTVKPVALMKYLVTLVTPKEGKVLDPFNGSGSTGMAVKEFGGEYVGIELDPNYIEISKKRIKAYESYYNI